VVSKIAVVQPNFGGDVDDVKNANPQGNYFEQNFKEEFVMKKKLFAAMAAGALLCGMLTAPVSAAETYQKGDVNMDGIVDVADAQLVLQEYTFALVGVDYGLTSEQLELASITGSMTKLFNSEQVIPIGVSDANVILMYYGDQLVVDSSAADIVSYYNQIYKTK
jgi:hypothetical protein